MKEELLDGGEDERVYSLAQFELFKSKKETITSLEERMQKVSFKGGEKITLEPETGETGCF